MDSEFGTALAVLTEEAIGRIRKDPSKKQAVAKPEPTTASVVESLTRAAMPSLKQTARHFAACTRRERTMATQE